MTGQIDLRWVRRELGKARLQRDQCIARLEDMKQELLTLEAKVTGFAELKKYLEQAGNTEPE